MSMPKAALLPDRGVIGIAGEDARSFLQALITNTIDDVADGKAVYAALLTPQGKYLFDFFIVEAEDRLLLDCDAAKLPGLIKRLGFYKLRAKVSIEDMSSRLAVAAMWDGEAIRPLQDAILFADPRLATLGQRALLPRDAAKSLLAQSGAHLVEEQEYQRHRIRLGVGDTADFESERSFPLELNLDELNAIDFKKGCFIGQEVTSRVKRRGSVRKRLVSCHVEGNLPLPGTNISSGAREAGTVFSGDAASGIVLALLRLDFLDAPLTAGDSKLIPQPQVWLARSIEEAEHDGPDQD